MEENIQNTNQSTPTAPEMPTPPQSPSADMQQPPSSAPKKDGKPILLVGLALFMLIIVGALYILASKKVNETNKVLETPPAQVQIPTPTAIPSPTIGATENDVENIDLGNPEQDLNSIDQDLKQL